MLVAGEANVAHLHRRAFLDVEDDLHRRGGNCLHFGLDRRKLVAVLGLNRAQHCLGPLDLRRVELALHRKRDLFLFEAVQHIRLRNRVQTLVGNVADRRLFLNIDVQDHALLRVLALDAQVLEVAGVPERVKVAFYRRRVEGVADVRKQTRQHGFLRDAAVADYADLLHRLAGLLGKSASGRKHEKRESQQARASRCAAPPRAGPSGEMCLFFTWPRLLPRPCVQHKS